MTEAMAEQPAIVAEWIKQVTKERASAEAELEQVRLTSTGQISIAQLRAELETVGGLLPCPSRATQYLKARFYEEVGLEGTYDPHAKFLEARVLNGRVGGGTRCNPQYEVGTTELWL
jgi:hypothetical protein